MNRYLLPCMAVTLAACGGEQDFELSFGAQQNGVARGCGQDLEGLGPNGDIRAGVSDLRFYISNLRAFDAEGNELDLTLDASEFQYQSDAGDVALIDLTGNTEGACSPEAIAFAEGTARTNSSIVGTVSGDVNEVRFDVGVPQPVMRDVVSNFTAESAPSPLNEMHWSWAAAHRHFVFNFTVQTASGDTGDGYIHIGSRDCGGDGARALTDRDACGLINTPQVALTNFDPAQQRVDVDLGRLLTGLDFVAPIYDTETFEIIGSGPGVECHSAPAAQPHCNNIFSAVGVNPQDGSATAASNGVFMSAAK